MLKVTIKGDFRKTTRYLERLNHAEFMQNLMQYAEIGTQALADNTPKDSGVTAASWYSEIEETNDGLTIYWKNSNVNDGVPIAIILQYGHGTGTGGYVAGRDYINPALEPVFNEIADMIRREVESYA